MLTARGAATVISDRGSGACSASICFNWASSPTSTLLHRQHAIVEDGVEVAKSTFPAVDPLLLQRQAQLLGQVLAFLPRAAARWCSRRRRAGLR